MWLDAFYHSLNPVALSLGPLSIRWYGLAYLVGFVLAGVVMYRTAQRWKLNVTLDDVLNLMVGISFGVIVGARLFYVIFYGAGSISFVSGLSTSKDSATASDTPTEPEVF